MKKEESKNFLTYQIHKAKDEGRWDDPAEKKKVISEALESIAHMPDPVSRETFVQHLNRKAKVGDRALFDELGKIRKELNQDRERARRRQERRNDRNNDSRRRSTPAPHSVGFNDQVTGNNDRKIPDPPKKRPNYEKELIRLMLMYGREMIDYIGSLCNDRQFEDRELRNFYDDIIDRYKAKDEVSVEHYANREHPYPQLVGEIVLEEHTVSERHHEKVGIQYKRDKDPYMTAKGALKALKIHYLDRLQLDLYNRYDSAEDEERKKVMKAMKEAGRQRTLLQQSPLDELFPDPESDSAKRVSEKVFEYKMKHEK
jgi:DNA primase